MKTEVIVTLRIQGLHFWANCNLESVWYLEEPHRHEFHIKCRKAVSHEDRDVEIIMLKNSIIDFFDKKYEKVRGTNIFDLEDSSCETIARLLVEEFDLTFAEVLEDGENGALVYNIE